MCPKFPFKFTNHQKAEVLQPWLACSLSKYVLLLLLLQPTYLPTATNQSTNLPISLCWPGHPSSSWPNHRSSIARPSLDYLLTFQFCPPTAAATYQGHFDGLLIHRLLFSHSLSNFALSSSLPTYVLHLKSYFSCPVPTDWYQYQSLVPVPEYRFRNLRKLNCFKSFSNHFYLVR